MANTIGTSLDAPHNTIASLKPMLTTRLGTTTGLIIFGYTSDSGALDTTANTYEKGAVIIQAPMSYGKPAYWINTGSAAVPLWSTALTVTPKGTAVNYLLGTSSATGLAPTLGVDGTDANIGLRIIPKGTGRVQIGTQQMSGVCTVQAVNFIDNESGAAAALVASLKDANGKAVTVGNGLRILLKTNNTLTAGLTTNTLNLNGSGVKNIAKFSGGRLQTAVAAGSFLDMVFYNNIWQLLNTNS